MTIFLLTHKLLSMKALFRIIVIVVAMAAFTFPMTARQNRARKPVSHEQLIEKQAKQIAEKLDFSPEISEKFISTYKDCHRELRAVKPLEDRRRDSGMSEARADSIIKARFDNSQRILDIRRKYYAEYCKFLKPTQIQRVYEMESRISKRLAHKRSPRPSKK